MRPQTGFLVSALGEEFRSAREARSLSLSDVAERLHIRSVYLAAIEDEDWHVDRCAGLRARLHANVRSIFGARSRGGRRPVLH